MVGWLRLNIWLLYVSLIDCRICKPPSLSRGRGIHVVSSLHSIPYNEPAVLQQYITNPLLLKGHKYDLRLYVLVTSVQPLECFLYDEGFGQSCIPPYNLSMHCGRGDVRIDVCVCV